ncbi:MAG: SH3 domain-containing protein [Candidatus Riflebacteria bacterium]|nr:SH3 domain-containing protein [Candidatus Riflebacteria bacterium]
MKKIKVFSVLVIVVSVVAVGIFMGKQMFTYLESRSGLPAPAGAIAPSGGVLATAEAAPSQGATQVLYTATPSGAPNPVPSPAPSTPESSPGPSAAATPVPPAPPPAKAGSPSPDPHVKLVAFANGNGINVREIPDVSGKMVMKIGNGTRGHVIDRKNGWTQVKWDFNKKVGWTRDDLLIVGPKDTLTGIPPESGSGTTRVIIDPTTRKPVPVDPAALKAMALAQTVSVAVAKPAPPAETVKGFASADKLPAEGTVVADSGAKVRNAPSTKAALLGKVPKGVVVKIKSCKRIGKYQWFEITYHQGRKEGWTREDNLQF